MKDPEHRITGGAIGATSTDLNTTCVTISGADIICSPRQQVTICCSGTAIHVKYFHRTAGVAGEQLNFKFKAGIATDIVGIDGVTIVVGIHQKGKSECTRCLVGYPNGKYQIFVPIIDGAVRVDDGVVGIVVAAISIGHQIRIAAAATSLDVTVWLRAVERRPVHIGTTSTGEHFKLEVFVVHAGEAGTVVHGKISVIIPVEERVGPCIDGAGCATGGLTKQLRTSRNRQRENQRKRTPNYAAGGSRENHNVEVEGQ